MKRSARALVLVAFVAAVAAVLIARGRTRTPPAAPAAEARASARPLPRLVDLGAGKCIPCKEMAPILEQLRTEYAGRLEVRFIDVWQDPEAARPFALHMIPTQIFFDASGRELARHEGFMAKDEILAQWRSLGVSL